MKTQQKTSTIPDLSVLLVQFLYTAQQVVRVIFTSFGNVPMFFRRRTVDIMFISPFPGYAGMRTPSRWLRYVSVALTRISKEHVLGWGEGRKTAVLERG